MVEASGLGKGQDAGTPELPRNQEHREALTISRLRLVICRPRRQSLPGREADYRTIAAGCARKSLRASARTRRAVAAQIILRVGLAACAVLALEYCKVLVSASRSISVERSAIRLSSSMRHDLRVRRHQ